MRLVLTTAMGIALGAGCATEEQARREQASVEKGGQVAVTETRTRDDAAAQAERNRRLEEARACEARRAEQARLRAQRAQCELERAQRAQAQLAEELDDERRERREAEQTARAALEEVGTVREEARGLVVTLAGPLLFAFDEDTLLPTAKEKLDTLAEALRASGQQSLRVEGHADSIGPAEYNLDLSRRRAEAVRSYLGSRGVDEDQIDASGYGEQRPLTSNDSPEGRANNRRVEIVLPEFGIGGAEQPGESPR